MTQSRLHALVKSCLFALLVQVYGVEKAKFHPHVFTLPDGYALKRVAASPLVKRPIHMYFDLDGSLYLTDRNVLDFNAQGHRPRVGGEQIIAEIIYWERPEGGRVFHTGSIATAWAMYYDEPLRNLVRKVLDHFKVKPKK